MSDSLPPWVHSLAQFHRSLEATVNLPGEPDDEADDEPDEQSARAALLGPPFWPINRRIEPVVGENVIAVAYLADLSSEAGRVLVDLDAAGVVPVLNSQPQAQDPIQTARADLAALQTSFERAMALNEPCNLPRALKEYGEAFQNAINAASGDGQATVSRTRFLRNDDGSSVKVEVHKDQHAIKINGRLIKIEGSERWDVFWLLWKNAPSTVDLSKALEGDPNTPTPLSPSFSTDTW